ncbi:MAG: 2-amino-4-hydroxy-6-hydroxymethyldihydropteridine diphosphokinase [bacterium]
MQKILLLLGTNLGDLKNNLIKAQKELENRKIKIVNRSNVYQTKPWGRVDQPDFLNMGLEISCYYKPLELLSVLKQIEAIMGRKSESMRWGPRIVDIDIIFYGSQVIESLHLTIPHKDFFNRPFAIKILAEIAPDFIPPCSKKKLQDYLNGIEHEGFKIYRS